MRIRLLKNLNDCHNIIEGLIKEHHGRIFNTAGDSVLKEFQMQLMQLSVPKIFNKQSKNETILLSEGEKMQFRLGIDFGDVVIEGENFMEMV